MTSQLKENQILHEGIIFNLIKGDPNGSDGYVYIQEQLDFDANYCVKTLYNGKIIEVLKNKNDAIAVSKYAASHDGGYGDVCIMSIRQPCNSRGALRLDFGLVQKPAPENSIRCRMCPHGFVWAGNSSLAVSTEGF